MIQYIMLIAAAALFAIQFLFHKQYQLQYGSHFKSAVVFSVFTGGMMALITFLIAGGKVWITPFTALVAFAHAVDSLLFMYCSLKALSCTNLSVFSVFSMLGGMLLPFFYGICIGGEQLTVGKAICCALVTVSVLCTIEGKRGEKKAWIYYGAVFILNGITSVCAAVHQSYPHMSADSNSFMVWSNLFLMMISLGILPFVKGEKIHLAKSAVLYMGGYSVCSGLGNLFLLLALLVLPASVQYPFVTGGTVVFSAILTLLQREKINRGERLSVLIALCASVCMVF